MEGEWKTVHLLRHGHGYHNHDIVALNLGLLYRLIFDGGWRRLSTDVIWRLWRSFCYVLSTLFFQARVSVLSPDKVEHLDDQFDASLTPTGWKQVVERGKLIRQTGLFDKVDLVVVSPMTRTLQTAAGVFGGGDVYHDDSSEPLIMVNGVGKTPYPGGSISSHGSPPFVANELCREHIGTSRADHRRDISVYKGQFPGVDFSLIKDNEDVLWRPDVSETNDEIHQRIKEFLQWLLSREEKEIAVVSHCGFLSRLVDFNKYGICPDQVPSSFGNCELRTVKIGLDLEQEPQVMVLH